MPCRLWVRQHTGHEAGRKRDEEIKDTFPILRKPINGGGDE